LIEAADQLHDRLTDEEKLPLTRALNACFAAHYFLGGSNDGETVQLIDRIRADKGRAPLPQWAIRKRPTLRVVEVRGCPRKEVAEACE
jgi:hypothetical protein